MIRRQRRKIKLVKPRGRPLKNKKVEEQPTDNVEDAYCMSNAILITGGYSFRPVGFKKLIDHGYKENEIIDFGLGL